MPKSAKQTGVKPTTTKSADTTYWINLYWAERHGQLMCTQAKHFSQEAADTEHYANRLMFDVRRIGNKAHKVTFYEKEKTVHVQSIWKQGAKRDAAKKPHKA